MLMKGIMNKPAVCLCISMRTLAVLLLAGLSLAGGAAYAVEFEVLDKLSVDGYSEFKSSAAVSSGLFTVGTSTFVVKSGNVGIGTAGPVSKLDVYETAAVNNQAVLRNAGTYHTGIIGTSTADPYTDNTAWGIFGGPNSYISQSANSMAIALPAGIPDFRIITGMSNLNNAGTVKMVVQQGGNVGIGTAAPGAKLHINGDLLLSGASATTGDYLSAAGGNTSAYNGLALISNGRGVGAQANTSLPSWLVDVGGRAADGSTYKVSTSDQFRVARIPAGGSFYGSDAFFVINNTGNVGIGTAAPATLLHLSGTEPEILSANPNWAKGSLFIHDTGVFDSGTAPTIVFSKERDSSHNTTQVAAISGQGTYPATRLDFFTGGGYSLGATAKMSIDSSGNVGIGTTGPSEKLSVAGNISIDVTNMAGVIHRGTANGSNGLQIAGNTSASVTDTYPGASLLVGGGALTDTYEGNIDLNAYGGVQNSPNRNVIRFNRRTGANTVSESMRIDGSGNVGIGTTATSSGAKLTVAGDIVGSAQVFRAYLTAAFSKAATWEKIPFNATAYNTLQGTFNTGLNRFTASRAGYYQVSVTGFSPTAGTGSERYAFSVSRSGTGVALAGGNYSAADNPLTGITMILYLNGSTDYVEIMMFSAIPVTLASGTGEYGMAWFMSYLGS